MERLAEVLTLLSTYARGYDTGDWPSISACFTPDGAFELVTNGGADTVTYTGTAELDAFMQASLAEQHDVRRHFSTNFQLLADDGDHVRVASYLLLGVAEPGGLRIVQSGRYEDTIVFVGGQPKFAHRRLTMDGTF
jgi:hypothetical protein